MLTTEDRIKAERLIADLNKPGLTTQAEYELMQRYQAEQAAMKSRYTYAPQVNPHPNKQVIGKFGDRFVYADGTMSEPATPRDYKLGDL